MILFADGADMAVVIRRESVTRAKKNVHLLLTHSSSATTDDMEIFTDTSSKKALEADNGTAPVPRGARIGR